MPQFETPLPKTLVLWNPRSGKASLAAEIRDFLLEQPQVTLRESTSKEESEAWAAAAASEGYKMVVAAGGDGAINAAVNGILQSGGDVVLGVLPIGTANDFAYSLGIPDDLDEACSLLSGGEVRALDVGTYETRSGRGYFANVAAGGNSDRVTESLTNDLKQTWGALCYLRGAIAVLTDLTSFQTSVSFDGEPAMDLKLWNVIVANGRTNAGRLHFAPLASLEDGQLDIILIRDGTVLDLASLAGQFLLSDYLRSEQIIFRKATQFTLQADPPMYFSVDGEKVPDPLLSFRVLPQALRVIVGPEYLPEPPAE